MHYNDPQECFLEKLQHKLNTLYSILDHRTVLTFVYIGPTVCFTVYCYASVNFWQEHQRSNNRATLCRTAADMPQENACVVCRNSMHVHNLIICPIAIAYRMEQIIGSRPSDHYFRSVCLSVCLFVCLFVCAEFFSAVFDPISIKLGHMLYVSVQLCPLEYKGCATPGGWVTPKKLVFVGVLGLKKLSRPTVLIGLC